MSIYCLQHVEFEGPGAIAAWARSRDRKASVVCLHRGEGVPAVDDLVGLIVLGGPMSIHDSDTYSWLADERALIREAVNHDKPVFGVCLGAQQIAAALGAKVVPASTKEIGWHSVQRVSSEGVGKLLPPMFTPLHWHGEAFELPVGAVLLARSEAVRHQAFSIGKRVVALQFHLEATPDSVRALVNGAGGQIGESPYEQSATRILEGVDGCMALNEILYALLDRLFL